ncbi:MAG TPA: hypothetical protein VGM75_01025 [Pseudonocardiaceae bacterium]
MRAALLVGAAASVVAISACSSTSSGAPAPSQPTTTTAQAPAIAPSTQVSLPAAVGGTPANAAAPAAPEVVSVPAPARIYFPHCGSQTVKSKIEMTSATFSCDSTLMMSNAHWTSWNSSHAEGTAVLIENDCNPDCAGGNLAHNKVDIRFDKPVTLSCGEFWTEAVFTYIGKPVGVLDYKPTWTFNPAPAGVYC